MPELLASPPTSRNASGQALSKGKGASNIGFQMVLNVVERS
jgi:hypothetical protein